MHIHIHIYTHPSASSSPTTTLTMNLRQQQPLHHEPPPTTLICFILADNNHYAYSYIHTPISTNNPYTINLRFILADTLQKLIVLAALAIWAKLSSSGSLEWAITLFFISTLPNTLVMGIPLLQGMYVAESGSLMVQIIVLQCIIWYTLMLFLFEYRGAILLISERSSCIALLLCPKSLFGTTA
ncbi:unnamed protein product [Rhodiola kirilowii]